MIKYKSIRYRIYPNKEQENIINQTFGCCQKVWNLMLNDWKSSYKETGKTIYTTPAKYKKEYPYLRNVDACALSGEQMKLKLAYKRFFEKTGKLPKFKSRKNSKKSYRTYNNHKSNTLVVGKNNIRLPKYGYVKAKIHFIPDSTWWASSATIFLDTTGAYYASVKFKYEEDQPTYIIDPSKVIGLDYKSNGLYIDSEGNTGSIHKYFRESEKKLARAQRKMSKRKLGSKNRDKQRKKVAKISRHITNQRKDALHKISRMLVNKYDIICVESLNLSALSRRLNLGKSTMDNGFGMLRLFIDYKAKDLGKVMIKVARNYPSTQTCSHCGHKYGINLRDRVYKCPNCGLEIDRDLNAAINIKNEGLRLFMETL